QCDQAIKYYLKALSSMANDIDQEILIHNVRITLVYRQQYEDSLRCLEQ
ncbi:unnamed protein product, partial [Rotaria sp. Silwood2]